MIEFSKLIIIAIVAGIIAVLSVTLVPDFIYNRVENKKIEKILEHDLVKAIWILSTLIIDTYLIIGFINLIC